MTHSLTSPIIKVSPLSFGDRIKEEYVHQDNPQTAHTHWTWQVGCLDPYYGLLEITGDY